MQKSLVLFAALAAALTVGCQAAPIEPPNSPDLQAVRADFDTPDGRLTPETANALVRALSDYDGYLATVDVLAEFFVQVIESLVKSDTSESALMVDDGPLSVRRSPLTLEGGAWARLRYICGPPEVVDEAANGFTELNMILDDPSLSALYWGTLSRCLIESSNGPLTIDADIIIDASADGELIAALAGTIVEAGESRVTNFAFRTQSDTISLVEFVDDKSFVITLPRTAESSVGLRDCAGDWTCDLETTSCRFSSASGTCDPVEQVISWP